MLSDIVPIGGADGDGDADGVTRMCCKYIVFVGVQYCLEIDAEKEVLSVFLVVVDFSNIPKITFSVGIWMSRGMDAVCKARQCIIPCCYFATWMSRTEMVVPFMPDLKHFNSETNTLLS